MPFFNKHSRSMTRIAVVSLFSLAILAGCGAADDSPSSGTSAAPSGGSSGSGSGGLNAFANELVTLVNSERAAGAVCGTETKSAAPPLQWNTLLEQAAVGHSQFMQGTETFSHTGSGGSSVGSRVTATGYSWSTVGENIAAGQPSSGDVMQAWMNSPGHCANIMNSNFSQMGIALVNGTGGNTYSTYWTMVLAAPR